MYLYIYICIYMQSLTRVYLQLFISRFYISGKALSTIGPSSAHIIRARRNIIPHVLFIVHASRNNSHSTFVKNASHTIYFFRSFDVSAFSLFSFFLFSLALSFALSRSLSPEEYLRDHSLFTMQKCKVYLQNMCVPLLVNICVLFRSD